MHFTCIFPFHFSHYFLQEVQHYSMTKIKSKFGLSQRDLVAMALLSGCDYGDGIKSIGPRKVMELIKKIKGYHDSAFDAKTGMDCLERIVRWKENERLEEMKKERSVLNSTTKSSHCSQCCHPGEISFLSVH